MLVKISKGYQLTIPAEIRHKFGLKPGVDVSISVKKNEIVIAPLEDVKIDAVYRRADRFKPHNLSPKDLEKMEDGFY